MNKRVYYFLWAQTFLACALLSVLSGIPEGLKGILTFMTVIFFLPPAVVLNKAKDTGDRKAAMLVRNISIASLSLTTVMIILNFVLAPLCSEVVGKFLHYALVVISCPMMCGKSWALSLFLWACLLLMSISQLKEGNKKA